jgi:hypothetical protein
MSSSVETRRCGLLNVGQVSPYVFIVLAPGAVEMSDCSRPALDWTGCGDIVAAMAVGLADNRDLGRQQSLPDG